MKRLLTVIAASMVLASATAWAKTETIKGQVVDQTCYRSSSDLRVAEWSSGTTILVTREWILSTSVPHRLRGGRSPSRPTGCSRLTAYCGAARSSIPSTLMTLI